MQIPQNIVNMLSAKGKGYVEAAMKIAQGQKLVQEGTIEMAALDGRKLNNNFNAGGIDVMSTVRGLARPKVAPESIRAILKDGEKSTRELATALGRTIKYTRDLAAKCDGVHMVGTGNKMRWALKPIAKMSRITKRPTLANKMTRRPSPKKGKKQTGKTAEQNMNLRKPNAKAEAENQALVLKALTAKPKQTIGPLMRSIKRSFYPVTRAVAALVKDGKLKKVSVRDKNEREQTTWEIVGGA